VAKIQRALNFGKRTKGREKIPHLDIRNTSKKLIATYQKYAI